MKKHLIPAMFSALLLTGCQVGNVTFNYIENPNTVPPEPVVTEAPAAEDETEPDANPDTNKSDQLYQELYDHFNQGETEFTLNIPQNDDSLLQLTQRMKKEHPEFFWLSYGYHSVNYREYAEITFDLYEDINPDEIPEMRKKFDQAAAEVLAQVPSDATDYEKIVWIHDWLVNHNVYDIDGKNSPALGGIYSTAYGAIVNGKAVCNGYAKAFQYFMNQFGIEGDIISGRAHSESHAWNYVILDGEYYWVDVTWDDPISTDGTQQLHHKYLLIPDEVLMRNHTPKTEPEINPFIPNCTGTKYNYFRMNNCYLETYSRQAVADIIKAHPDDKFVEIMFRNEQDYNLAVKELYQETKIYELVPPEWNTTLYFSQDEETYVMKIERDRN